MILLAVDTALDACAAAVVFDRGGAVEVVAVTEVIGRGHAEKLMAVVGEALARAGVGHGDLDGYVVSIGPGSFTGIRVGVAAVRGFALATAKPALGVTSLEALADEARALRPDRAVFAALDARKDEVYVQGFCTGGAPIAAPAVLSRAAAAAQARLAGALLIGSGAPLLAAIDPTLDVLGAGEFPAIETIARIGLARFPTRDPAAPMPAPLYVRAPDAKPQGASRLARLVPGAFAPLASEADA